MDTRLYIIMRNDMDSLNPGKAMAQAAHAANQFMHGMNKKGINKDDLRSYEDWLGQSDHGFGTTIVLAATCEEMNYAFGSLTNAHVPKHYFGIVRDSTYPVQDGRTMHYIPVYAFEDGSGKVKDLLGHLKLHK